MTQTETTLLSLLRRALFGHETAPIPAETDFDLLLREAAHHTVIPMVYDALTPSERAQMPPELSQMWHMTVMRTLWQNEQTAAEQRRVLGLLQSAGLPCVILKGSSSAMHYPKPELRTSGDIDLLLSPAHIDRAQELLLAQGYALSHNEDGTASHRALRRGPFILELHHAPSGLPKTPTGDALRAYFLGAEEAPLIRDSLPMLPPEKRAVLLLAHKLEHVTTSGLGLRHLCDWAAFVARELDKELWRSLTPALKSFGLYRFGEIATRACVEHLGLSPDTAPWCLGVEPGLADALVEDILLSGNFGHKENRYGQRLFTDVGSGNRVSSFLRTGLRVCREQWEPCRKCALLLPVAPAVLLWRYRKQRKQGLRPALKPVSVYQGAEKRQKLYKQLRPFLPEEE